MRIAHDQLIFKALAALDQAVEDCREAPLQPTFALRFVLAWLYAVSDGNGDRRNYDEFWRHLQYPGREDAAEWERKYLRSTNARSSLWGIARSVGVPAEVKLWHRIADAHRGPDRHKKELIRTVLTDTTDRPISPAPKAPSEFRRNARRNEGRR